MLKNELCNYINDDKTADIERFIRAGASDNENDTNTYRFVFSFGLKAL